ncbi:methionyl-tRNA formyltransferase [bacterium]|nr:MAG: methionyl-tRNA formyltransferase [bacterium]
MGTPAFAVPSLRALLEARYQVVAAVTQPDRPSGRGGRLAPPEVKQAALEAGIPVFQFDTLKDDAARSEIEELSPDLFVVAAYGKILSRRVLAIPRRGCLNVHASLLPRWRGPSPIAAAILAGDAETGVSIMEMAPAMDAGPVVASATTPVLANDTTGSLSERLSVLGARLLVETLPGWYDRAISAAPQEDPLATYCPLLKKEDGHLRGEMTAAEAERAVRAYSPWPGAYVLYRGERLGIWKAHVDPRRLEDAAPAGAFAVCSGSPAIAFSNGLLVLDEVQRAGSRRQAGRDFLHGERGKLEPLATLA